MSVLQRIGAWLDERTGWRGSWQQWFDHPVLGGTAWASAIAASVATCLGVLALTGVVLMTSYAPSPQSAWASVFYVQHVEDGGWIVRGLHYWAAQALFALAALHVAHGAWTGGYRRPREIAWWLTLLVLGLAIGEGITGGLLPWDQRGWWARVVEGNIVGLAPGVGGWLQRMMQGGAELGGRGGAYTLHVALLPAAMGLATWGRRRMLLRVAGSDAGAPTTPYARQLARSALVAVAVVLALFTVTGGRHGAPLEPPADPMSDYPARPEWFLLPLFELRKFFHGAAEFWGTTLLPLAAGGYLALLPWIDAPRRRRALVVHLPVALVFGGAVALALAPLRKDARDAQYGKQRAKIDARAAAAVDLAQRGVPPEGPLAMIRNDPELRGADLFEQHCASCHVLGDAGDPRKATATKLDGWGTPAWIERMIHDPDAADLFGRGPYKEQMPSVDVRPKDKTPEQAWSPMVKGETERRAVALFLASLGDEPGDPPRALDEAIRAQGEKIFSERCTSCHLYKGDGDDEGTGVAPEMAGYGTVAWTRAQIADPSSPKTYREKALDPAMKKHMPRFDKDLSPADVDVLARWTRAHARGVPLR
jgi:ubiquinol-cytochrome c reductase cytochrome b subunit